MLTILPPDDDSTLSITANESNENSFGKKRFYLKLKIYYKNHSLFATSGYYYGRLVYLDQLVCSEQGKINYLALERFVLRCTIDDDKQLELMKVTFTYKDEDQNDNILISSTDELQCAIDDVVGSSNKQRNCLNLTAKIERKGKYSLFLMGTDDLRSTVTTTISYCGIVMTIVCAILVFMLILTVLLSANFSFHVPTSLPTTTTSSKTSAYHFPQNLEPTTPTTTTTATTTNSCTSNLQISNNTETITEEIHRRLTKLEKSFKEMSECCLPIQNVADEKEKLKNKNKIRVEADATIEEATEAAAKNTTQQLNKKIPKLDWVEFVKQMNSRLEQLDLRTALEVNKTVLDKHKNKNTSQDRSKVFDWEILRENQLKVKERLDQLENYTKLLMEKTKELGYNMTSAQLDMLSIGNNQKEVNRRLGELERNNNKRWVQSQLLANTTNQRIDRLELTQIYAINLPRETIQSFDYPSSSQSKAYRWLLDDPLFNVYPEWRKLQRFVLATLFFATKGEDWIDNTSWLNYEIHECYWYSQHYENSCSSTDDPHDERYKYLRLHSNALQGSLPRELSLLSSITDIRLHNNLLEGSIPTQIGKLTMLQHLDLDNNFLVGTIPSEMGNLRELSHLGLHNNKISGTIPMEFGQLITLHRALLDRNDLSGTVPVNLCYSVKYLYVDCSEVDCSTGCCTCHEQR